MREQDLMKLDLYGILGIPVNSGIEAIKKAYRRRALQTHPDKNSDRNATSNFQLLAAIFGMLKDEKKKAKYDRMLVERRMTQLRELRADIEQFYVDVKAEKWKLKSLLNLCRTDTIFGAHRHKVIFCNSKDLAQLLMSIFEIEGIIRYDDDKRRCDTDEISVSKTAFWCDSSPPSKYDESITLIINYQLPDDPKLYGKRVNRGAEYRINQDGRPKNVRNKKVLVINFVATAADLIKLKNIEKYYRTNIVEVPVNPG